MDYICVRWVLPKVLGSPLPLAQPHQMSLAIRSSEEEEKNLSREMKIAEILSCDTYLCRPITIQKSQYIFHVMKFSLSH